MPPRALLALLLCGCSGAAGPRDAARPNVLLILSDDQRLDTIGNPLVWTPNLDALAREGTVFTRAVSPNPVCLPSRAEILTGTSGFRNGVLPGFTDRLDAALPTWSATMAAAGYRTAYAGKWHTPGKPRDRGYAESPGFFTGGLKGAPRRKDLLGREITGYHGWVFQTEDGARFPERGVGLTEETDVRIAEAAIEFVRRPHDRPYFLHVNFTSPHDPLMPPGRHRSRYDPARMPLPKNFMPGHPFDHGNLAGRDERLWPSPRTPEDVRAELALYYAAISHVDEQVGRLLDAVRGTRTIVVFSSDHGLAIGSHGLRGKQNLYEHTVGVPLIFSGPGIPKGERRAAQVYLRELFPTVCELAGIPAPVEGSFARVVRGETDRHHDAVFGYWTDAQRMIRTDEWKLIVYPRAGRVQLFHLPGDPFELTDLSLDPARAETRDALRARLEAWQAEVRDPLLRR